MQVVVMMSYGMSDSMSNSEAALTKKYDDEEADSDTTGDNDFNYYGVDSEYDFFYSAVCISIDGSLLRMFLVNDTETVIAKLNATALIYPVIGASVNEYATLCLAEAKYGDDYASTGDTEEM
jgi:hypothetical protein